MKYILVTIRKNLLGEPRMRYPSVYKAHEVELNKEGPIIYNGGLKRGDTAECLIKVSNQLANKYAKDPDIRIITATEADAWLSNNPEVQNQPNERVTDSDRLLAIIAKKMAGVQLTQEDKDALIPNKPTKGINKVPKTVREIFS